MKRIFTTAIAVLFLAGMASIANAGDFGHFGHGSRGFGRVRIGNVGISFGGGGYGGYGHGVRYVAPRRHHQRHYAPRLAVFHDTTHLDYHGPTVVRHRGHLDYVPGHYDVHRTGHYDHY